MTPSPCAKSSSLLPYAAMTPDAVGGGAETASRCARSRAVRTRRSRLPAMVLMGASELLISWLSTRTSRCHACRSSARSVSLRSVTSSSACGRPPCRNSPRRTSQRPVPPGKLAESTRGACATPGTRSPSRSRSSSASVDAVSPSRRSAGRASRRSPCRFTRRSRPASSNANTATSISPMTRRSSAALSSARMRSSRSTAVSRFASCSARPSASSGRADRARNEKSPSRSAASTFASVCSGRTTCTRATSAPTIQTAATAPTSVDRPPGVKPARADSQAVAATAGAPAMSTSAKMRESWRIAGSGQRSALSDQPSSPRSSLALMMPHMRRHAGTARSD